jgi:hypothetical protein
VVNILIDEIAPLYPERNSGFTTMTRLGTRRGDSASMVKLSFIKQRKNTGQLTQPKVKPTQESQMNISISIKKKRCL